MDSLKQRIRNVTLVGLTVNLILSGAKLVGGIVASSSAVVADGVHSLSDTVTDIAILIGVRYWTAPPDENHPHGHHRIETLVTAVIGLVLAGVAIGLMVEAVTTLASPSDAQPPGWPALGVALVSIASKESLYRYTLKNGRSLNSAALLANAWHQRSDMLSSIPAALAVLGTKIFPDLTMLDSIGAIIVSLLILHTAYHIVFPALAQLVDTSAGPEIQKEIESLAMAIDGVKHVHAVRTRFMGAKITVDMHIEVDGRMTVQSGHALAGRVKHHIIDNGPEVADVVVHLEPEGDHLHSAPPV